MRTDGWMDVKERTKTKEKEEAAKVEGVEGMFREGATDRLTGRATRASAMWIGQTHDCSFSFVSCVVLLFCRSVVLSCCSSSVPYRSPRSSNYNWALTQLSNQLKPNRGRRNRNRNYRILLSDYVCSLY